MNITANVRCFEMYQMCVYCINESAKLCLTTQDVYSACIISICSHMHAKCHFSLYALIYFTAVQNSNRIIISAINGIIILNCSFHAQDRTQDAHF